LRARLTSHALRGLKLLGYHKAPDAEFVDLQPSDPGATDGQPTDGKCTDGYRTDCNGA